MTTPKPSAVPECKHYFTGGAMIMVTCMMCHQAESRSIHIPDENYDRLRQQNEELVKALKSEHESHVDDLIGGWEGRAHKDCEVCALIARATAGEGKL